MDQPAMQPDPDTARLDGVPDLLARARQLDPQDQAFGAREHRYLLAPPVEESDPLLEAIERRAGGRLPAGYRHFLRRVGNGGAGPGYGLFPLGATLDHPGDAKKEAGLDLGRPFPHTVAWEEADPPAGLSEEEGDRWYYALLDGSLPLADYGCGIIARLVVNGPARGQVWIDDRDSDNGIYPAGADIARALHGHRTREAASADDGETPGGDIALSFASWYLDWLERLLAHLEQRVAP